MQKKEKKCHKKLHRAEKSGNYFLLVKRTVQNILEFDSEQTHKKIKPTKPKKLQTLHPLLTPIAVRAMGMDENYSRVLDENMALIESPLIAPSNSHFRQHYKTALYPYNITSQISTGGGGYYATSEQDLNGNGDGEGHYNSVEKQSRYQPQKKCVNVKLR